MERTDLYEHLKALDPEALAAYYQQALDRFIDRLRGDPAVVALILAGSFAYDRVWYRSDMDLTLVVRDQTLHNTSYTLDEDGIVLNTSIQTRTQFRQALQRSKGGDMAHSMFARAKVVYTVDESIHDLLADAQAMGPDDIALAFFSYSGWLLAFMEKVEKWLVVRRDPQYAQLYVLECAQALAHMALVLRGVAPNRESILRVMALEPDFMRPFYTDPLTRALTEAEVYERLEGMTRFLEEHLDLLAQPALRYLEDGDAKTASMISKHFKIEGIYHTFDFLAERGLIERVTQSIRITPKGRKGLEEVAYLYAGGLL